MGGGGEGGGGIITILLSTYTEKSISLCCNHNYICNHKHENLQKSQSVYVAITITYVTINMKTSPCTCGIYVTV